MMPIIFNFSKIDESSSIWSYLSRFKSVNTANSLVGVNPIFAVKHANYYFKSTISLGYPN